MDSGSIFNVFGGGREHRPLPPLHGSQVEDLRGLMVVAADHHDLGALLGVFDPPADVVKPVLCRSWDWGPLELLQVEEVGAVIK